MGTSLVHERSVLRGASMVSAVCCLASGLDTQDRIRRLPQVGGRTVTICRGAASPPLQVGIGASPALAAESSAPPLCMPNRHMLLNVSTDADWLTLHPALRASSMSGLRVEVNGQARAPAMAPCDCPNAQCLVNEDRDLAFASG